MKPIRIAQIGTSTNSHGNDIFNTLKTMPQFFEIVGYAFPENEREKFPERMADFEGYRELSVEEILNDPTIEAVTVETEETYLAKYALMAAKQGKHIHMEKPGGVVLTDFERLIQCVKENGKVFHTGYMYRYNPFVKELKEQIKNGEFGEILSVEAQMNCYYPAEKRQWLSRYPGGMMFFLGCHLVDLVLQLKGTPKRILPMNKCSGYEGITATDNGFALLEYDNGVSFVKTYASEIGGYVRRHLTVVGSKKTMELLPFEMFDGEGYALYSDRTEYTDTEWTDKGQKTRAHFDRYAAMIEAFAHMVAGEMENPYTAEYELELYKAVMACCEVSDA